MKKILTLITAIMLSGCVHLNTVSLTQIPQERSNTVEVSKSEMLFLGIAFDNDFVNELTDELRGKCANGRIQGILTKYETTVYFIVIERKITATGYCIHDSTETV